MRQRGPHREERGARTRRPRAGGAEVRRGGAVLAEPALRLPQHCQRLPLSVVLEPGLAGEQPAGAVVAPRVHFGFGAFDHQECVGV